MKYPNRLGKEGRIEEVSCEVEAGTHWAYGPGRQTKLNRHSFWWCNHSMSFIRYTKIDIMHVIIDILPGIIDSIVVIIDIINNKTDIKKEARIYRRRHR